MQDGHNYYGICPNFHAQYDCTCENIQDVYLPQPVLFPQTTAEPHDCVTKMYMPQDSRIDSTVGDPGVSAWSNGFQQCRL
ncbi:hypothetical protein FKM82_023645 [Ascaphus truei]